MPHCRHDKLYFGSGDYYVFCAGCDARWGRLDPRGTRREYGTDKDGNEIGCMPEAANQGASLGNQDVRVASSNPWKPMSSAPKDRPIDLMFPEPRGRTVNCSWQLGGWGFYTPFWPNGLDGEMEPMWNTYPNMQPLAWMDCPPRPEQR